MSRALVTLVTRNYSPRMARSRSSRHQHKMSLLRKGGSRRLEGQGFRQGGGEGDGHRFSARFSLTKNLDGERPAFSKTGFVRSRRAMMT